MATYSFTLYVAGQTQRSHEALQNLRRLCETCLQGYYELKVIDAVERPELAKQGRILATPKVIKLKPLPQRRVIGDLSDHHRAAQALGLPNANDLSMGVQ